MKTILNLNEDGTIQLDAEKISDWCRKHKMGLVISVGPEQNEAYQNVHFIERAQVMAGKDLLIAKLKVEADALAG